MMIHDDDGEADVLRQGEEMVKLVTAAGAAWSSV